jgi:hypothetical protein
MDQKPLTVLGIYPTRAAVETAVEAFRDAGFRNADISLVVPENTSTENLFAQGATSSTKDTTEVIREGEFNRGPLGWLEEARPAKITGQATFIVAGPIARSLDDIDSDDPTEGLAAALNNLGVPRAGTKEYARSVVRGRALLSVHCDTPEEAAIATRLYGDLGGTDIYSTRGKAEPGAIQFERSVAC